MARALLFVGWMIVFWGSFVLLAFAWKAVSEGWGAALAAVVPLHHSDAWGWINLACVVIAVGVWSAVLVVMARLRGE